MSKTWISLFNHEHMPPSGGWRSYEFEIGGKKFQVKRSSAEKVFQGVLQIYRNNNVDISEEDIKEKLNDFWCGLSPERCHPPKTRKMLGFMDVVGAVNAAKQVVKGNVLSQEEIDKNVAICEKCPVITDKSKYPGAKKLAIVTDKARKLNGVDFFIPGWTKEKFCGVCHCSVYMGAVSKKENRHKDDAEEAKIRPETCYYFKD